MKTLKFDTKEEWLAGRRGRITGSKDITPKTKGSGRRIGFYELIAERLALPSVGSALDHGVSCEPEALERYEKEKGVELDKSLVIWTRDDNDSIAVSPDGFNLKKKLAVDAKCLSSARHIETFLTQKIPDDFDFQRLQYFIVNEELEQLDFAFYDPRMPEKAQFFCIEVKRKDVQEEIDQYLTYQRLVLDEVDEIVNKLTF